jgi:hypothetical protein
LHLQFLAVGPEDRAEVHEQVDDRVGVVLVAVELDAAAVAVVEEHDALGLFARRQRGVERVRHHRAELGEAVVRLAGAPDVVRVAMT